MARKPITRANPYTPTHGAFAGRTFTSERQYRNALAQAKGYRSLYEQQRVARPVYKAGALATLRPSEQQARQRAMHALNLMRHDGLSLKAAAKAAQTTPNAMQRYVAPALVTSHGRIRATAYDKLARPLTFLNRRGKFMLDVRDSRSAALIGKYWNAINQYLRTGDTRQLQAFRGKAVRVDKISYPFITDIPTLNMLADNGELEFESLYVAA